MDDGTDEPNPSEVPATPNRAKIGFGTLSIMMIFFGIITAMCIGAVLIVVVLAFR